MNYISALDLTNLCIKHEILVEKEGLVCVYREGRGSYKEGWYLEEKDTVAKCIMSDKDVANLLITELSKKGVIFVPKDNPLNV